MQSLSVLTDAGRPEAVTLIANDSIIEKYGQHSKAVRTLLDPQRRFHWITRRRKCIGTWLSGLITSMKLLCPKRKAAETEEDFREDAKGPIAQQARSGVAFDSLCP